MTTGSRPHPTPDPADVTSLLRLLAEAADSRAFFATLRRALPRVLPATRVDLLAGSWPGAYMSLAGAGDTTRPIRRAPAPPPLPPGCAKLPTTP